MASITLFTGGIRPLPETRRPTGMYKTRVDVPIALGPEGFAGDQQADRRVHGGPDKAVHLYPARHHPRLAARFPEAAAQLVPGALGENLSTPDLDEADVRIGELWQLGNAVLQVCQPRNPCWKIDERFGADGMAGFIAEHLLTGWYWRVVQPGHVSPGDTLDLLHAAPQAPSLREAQLLWQAHRPAVAELERLADTPGLARAWRDKIVQRLTWLKTLA